jgi:hypothetical protein
MNPIDILVQLPNFVEASLVCKKNIPPPKNARNIILPLFSDPSPSVDHVTIVEIRIDIQHNIHFKLSS